MRYDVLNQLKVKNKRVFLRVDFNVPIVNKKILDDSRIKAHDATICHLMDKGAKIVLGTHVGRPKLPAASAEGMDGNSMDTNVLILFKHLKKIYGDKISFVDACVGEEVNFNIMHLRSGHLLLLQNLRYESAEQSGNEGEMRNFAKTLSSYIDIYVNDALSVCQNKDASVFYLPQYTKNTAIGFLLQKEIHLIEKLVSPVLPAAAFLGGFKVQDKIGVMQKFLKKGFEVFIGGAMRNPFLKFQKYAIGSSKLDADYNDVLRQIMEDFRDRIHIPIDVKTGTILDKEKKRIGNVRYVDFLKKEEIPEGEEALDNGPGTMLLYRKIIKQKGMETLFANGPFGLIENKSFRFGTFQLARIFLENQHAHRVYGGGDIIHGFNLFSERFNRDRESLGERCYAGNGVLQYIASDGDLPGLCALTRETL
ncbi:MAG: phosphoglycerate kinase [Candidatus Brocadiaceae bacterium]|nr:phosphoglycerate kinase [Candidatus Brocadiaceae bacterium]